MTEHLDRPRSARDPGFKRRFEALRRAGTDEAARAEVLAQPLVADRTFTPGLPVDCPAGHVADHPADWPPVAHDGRPHVVRSCERCTNGWLEAIDLML